MSVTEETKIKDIIPEGYVLDFKRKHIVVYSSDDNQNHITIFIKKKILNKKPICQKPSDECFPIKRNPGKCIGCQFYY